MTPLQFIAPTKRKAMTKARAARIFLAHNGKCCNCGQQIRQGEGWFVEHPVSLAQGGADDETNTAPAHTKCKSAKDATDAASKAKRDRLVTAGWEREQPRRSSFQSKGFNKASAQHSATRPLVRRSERLPS